MSEQKRMADNLASLGALLISILTMIGGGWAYLSDRRRRKAQAEGEEISNVLRLSERVATLEEERATDYEERRKLQRELWNAGGRIYLLEKQQREDGLLLTVAIEYISVLSKQLIDAGGKPPPLPTEIDEWLKKHESQGGGQ